MTKQDVIYFLTGIDNNYLTARMSNSDLKHAVIANDLFVMCSSELVTLPENISPLIASIFINKHGQDGYIALLEHITGKSVIPQYITPNQQNIKLTIAEEIDKLSRDFGNVDVSKVTKKDMVTVEQLIWLREIAHWIGYCAGSAKNNKLDDYWVVVQVMGIDVNVMLTRDMLAKTGVSRRGDVIGEQRSAFDNGGLTGLCDLAASRRNLTLTDSLTEVSKLTSERRRLTADNMSLSLQMNVIVGANKKYLTDAEYMEARKQRALNKKRISEIVQIMN